MKDWKKDPDYLRLSPKMQKAVKHLVTMKDKKNAKFCTQGFGGAGNGPVL